MNLNRLLRDRISVAAMCSKPEALAGWGEDRWTQMRCFAAAADLPDLEACGDEGMAHLARVRIETLAAEEAKQAEAPVELP
jgi:hypothetical protein